MAFKAIHLEKGALVPQVEAPQVAVLVGLVVGIGVGAADAHLRGKAVTMVVVAAAVAVTGLQSRTIKCTGCCCMCFARSIVMPVTCGVMRIMTMMPVAIAPGAAVLIIIGRKTMVKMAPMNAGKYATNRDKPQPITQ